MKDSVQKIADRLMKKYTEEQLENFTVGSAVPEDREENESVKTFELLSYAIHTGTATIIDRRKRQSTSSSTIVN